MNKQKIINEILYIRKKKRVNMKLKDYLKLYNSKLLKTEKEAIKKQWGNVTMSWYNFYKSYCGYFDARFVPSDFYNGIIEYTMNPRRFSLYYQHKGLFYQFIESKNRCKVLFNNYDNLFYDEFMKPISSEYCRNIICNVYGKIVVKPSVGTGGGRNVAVYDSQFAYNNFDKIFKGTNYIVQEFLNEGQDLKRFNPDTVNTLRVLSLNINGKCSILSSFLRIGAKGMFVDNLSSGGMLIGVNPDGVLYDYAVDKNLNKYIESPSGLKFKGITLKIYYKIKDFILNKHLKFPLANLIAWDVAINEQQEIVILEINLDSGEIQFHQMFNGPLFGERTDEVINYIKHHKIQRYTFI